MKLYMIRALKYLLRLVVLIAALYALMELGGMSRRHLGAGEWRLFMIDDHGWLLCCALVAISAFYPKFGYVKRRVEADMEADREVILQTFMTSGYALQREEPGVMVFRVSSPLRRMWLMGEDTIEVRAEQGAISLAGLRAQVVRNEFRLKSFLLK